MADRFPTSELRKHSNQLIKFNKQYVRECEITPDVNPFDISDVDAYYKRIEQWDANQLRWKLNRCKLASSVKDIYEVFMIDEIKEKMPRNFLGHVNDDLNVYKKRCRIALEKLKTAERVVLQGAYLPEEQRRYGYQIEIDTGLRGFDENSTEIIKEGCKYILEDKGLKHITHEVCPIVLDNALALHYEINRRNVEKGFYDLDIKSGVIVRDIERNCVDFPLIKDIPYIKNGREILRLRVEVSREPDRSGRVGRIDIIKPIPYHPIFDKFVNKDAKYVWDKLLTMEEKYEITRLVYPVEAIQISTISYLHLNPTLARFLYAIGRERGTLKKGVPYLLTIGSETCVWAQKTRPAAQLTKETAKISKAEYEAKNPLELAEITENFMESLEKMERGLIDAHPRQDLFDSAVSTFEAWVEYDFDPNVIEPMLANMLYNHIAKIDPRLVSRNFLLMIEDQKEQGHEQWGWTKLWLDKYHTVKDTLSIDDWRHIIKLTKNPITSYLHTHDIDNLIANYGNLDPENREARIIEIRREFLDIDKFYYDIETLLLTDENFAEKWKTFIKMPFTKNIIFGHNITELMELQLLINNIKNELKVQRKKWKEKTPYDDWIDAFIQARDNDKIDVQGIDIGVAVEAYVSKSGGYMSVGVIDHHDNNWSGFQISDPASWFGGDSIRENWDEMTQEEQIQWASNNTDLEKDDFKGITKLGMENLLETTFMDEFFWSEMPCWDYENSEWDEACVLDSVYQDIDEISWSLR
ncbi:hypothetical protein LCGC14_0741700 [marine sediment metagenome]|uniref:Uncharacterized protein n=1 Tax=marine sediment metagenome TaxID=412755 RepID=A0A0F9SRH0_9ZZZZ